MEIHQILRIGKVQLNLSGGESLVYGIAQGRKFMFLCTSVLTYGGYVDGSSSRVVLEPLFMFLSD